MSFYSEQRRLNIELDNLFRDVITGVRYSVNLDRLKNRLLMEYAVSARYIDRHIKFLLSVYPTIVERDGDLVSLKDFSQSTLTDAQKLLMSD